MASERASAFKLVAPLNGGDSLNTADVYRKPAKMTTHGLKSVNFGCTSITMTQSRLSNRRSSQAKKYFEQGPWNYT